MQNRRTLFIGIIVFGLLTFFGSVVQAQYSQERTEREWRVKAEKMRTHLLPMMRKFDIDLWIIMSREFNPDPMLDLFGANGVTGWYGHRNAYLFYDAGEKGLETTIIGTHQSGHIKLFYLSLIHI